MSNTIDPIPGTSDIFAAEIEEWQFLEETARTVFGRYGYTEVRTPIIERTELFRRTLGDQSDIVQKEMYTFKDRGQRSLTLRPEGTAGVLRALMNQGMATGEEQRVFYSGPMFRGERPAAGRKRQFHQIGVECVGKVSPELDTECIAMLINYIKALGIEDVRLLLNSRGVDIDRELISQRLTEYFTPHTVQLCDDCQRRLEANVWRILDCKNPSCQEIINHAPSIIEVLHPTSQAYFQNVCNMLTYLGVAYQQHPRLIRGLDYYVHTVFEVTCEGIGAQNAIAGGGRYEFHLPGLKKPLQGIGFAFGVERLIMTRQQLGIAMAENAGIDIFIISLGDEARRQNFTLAERLREQNFRVMMDLEGKGLKAQLRQANKRDAKVALIRGDSELKASIILCKVMSESRQIEVAEANILSELQHVFTPKIVKHLG